MTLFSQHRTRQACYRAGRNLTQAEWALYLAGKDYRKTCDEWPED